MSATISPRDADSVGALKRLIEDWFIELIPRNPRPRIEGMVMIGRVLRVNEWPMFTLDCGCALLHFRVDENVETAVQLSDGSLWTIGRHSQAAQL